LHRVPHSCRWPLRRLFEAERAELSSQFPERGDGHRWMEHGETGSLHLAV
jgi:hypothetical protein